MLTTLLLLRHPMLLSTTYRRQISNYCKYEIRHTILYHTNTFTESLEINEVLERTVQGDKATLSKRHSVEITEIIDIPETRTKTDIEIIEEIDQERIIKKVLKTRRPYSGEYLLDEEDVDKILPIDFHPQTQLPQNIPSMVSEATHKDEITQIDRDLEKVKATVGILPLNAILQEQPISQDSEQPKTEVSTITQQAAQTVDQFEAYETSEINSQNIPEHFDSTLKPRSYNADRNVTITESLVIEETYAGDTSITFQSKQESETKAEFSIIEQNASNIQEVEVHQKEETLKPLEYDQKYPFETHIPKDTSEASSTSQVTQIDQTVEQATADINILPQMVPIQEKCEADEKEGDHKPSATVLSQASRTIDSVEAFETTEQNVQNQVGEYDETFKPSLSNAQPAFSISESINIHEINLGDIPATLPIEGQVEGQAFVSILEQEAKNIQQVDASDKEQDLEAFLVPKGVAATKAFIPQEGISIEEVQQAMSEDKMDIVKPVGVKPKMNIDTQESLIVEQVLTGDKPGKYLPQAFVATEVATRSVISQKSITQSHIQAPELEGEYTPGKLPPTQVANSHISVTEGILISQTQTEDKENAFSKANSPERANALEDILLHESLLVRTVDSQAPQGDLKAEDTEQFTATFDILEKQTVQIESVVAAESEKIYEQSPVDTKVATSDFRLLEVGENAFITAHESEIDLVPDEPKTKVLATSSIGPKQSLLVEEVETGDTPSEFTDHLKYKTDSAETNVHTTEAQVTIETQAGESEMPSEHSQPETCNIDTTITRTVEEICVTENQTMESEKLLEEFETPESQKGKQTRSHLLPTGVSEIVAVDDSESNLKIDNLEQGPASFNQPTLTETVISEAVADEGLKDIESEKPEEKQASSDVLPQEAVNISEVVADDSEKPYKSSDVITQEATVDVTFSQVASQSITESNVAPENLMVSKPVEETAQVDQSTFEPVYTLQHETAEKESEYIKQQLDTKSALLGLTEGLSGPNVSQVTINEKEDDYSPHITPLEGLGQPNITAHDVAVKTEMELVVHADEIIEDELPTGKAKKYTKPYNELIVTESNAVDVHQELPADIHPYSKHASIDILPGQALTITETSAEQNEEQLTVSDVDQSNAVVGIEEQQVAIKEQIVADNQTGDFDRISPEKQLGITRQDISHPLVQTEIAPGETEGYSAADIKPNSKQADVSFSEAEVVNVSEVLAGEKESNLARDEAPQVDQGSISIASHVIAVKEEVQPQDSTNALKEDEQRTENAKTQFSTLDTVITTESVVGEQESNIESEHRDAKTATSEFEEATPISVTSITAAIKESDLINDEINLNQAEPILSPQENIQVDEVLVNDFFTDLDRSSPTKFTVSPVHSQMQSITETELITGEKEANLEKDVQPLQQSAEVELGEITTAQTTETVVSEKEGKYDTEEAASLVALTSIDAQPVAESSQADSQDQISSIIEQKPNFANANPETSLVEGLTQTQTLAQEQEMYFERPVLDTKSATVDFTSQHAVSVSEVKSSETESELQLEEKPTGNQASVGLLGHELPVRSELEVNENTGDLQSSQPEHLSAQPDISALSTALQTETLISETEGKGPEAEKIDQRYLTVSIDEDVGVVVETVTVADKETDLVTERPTSKAAEVKISESNVIASQSEVKPNEGILDLEQLKPEESKASSSIIFSDTITQTQQTAIEAETDLADFKKPTSTAAVIGVESVEGITSEQTTLAEKEQHLADFQVPGSKTAVQNIDMPGKVAGYETTDIRENPGILQQSPFEQYQAQPADEVLNSLIVTQNVPEQKETDFQGEFKPETSTVELSLEKGRVVGNISEITTEEKEGHMADLERPHQQSAVPAIDAIQVPQTAETLSSDTTGVSEYQAPQSSSAVLKHDELCQLIQESPQLHEREDVFDRTVPLNKKQASIAFDEEQTVQTSQVVSAERETAFDKTPAPDTSTADASVSGHITAQVSEVLTTDQTTEYIVENPKETTAGQDQPTLNYLSQGQNMVLEDYLDQETPDIAEKTAETKIDAINYLDVSEVVLGDAYGKASKESMLVENAYAQIDEATALLQSHVVSNDALADLTEDVQNTQVVNIVQDMLQSIIESQSTVHDSEQPMDQQLKPDTKQADLSIGEMSSVEISQTVSDEKEGRFVPGERPEETSSLFILPHHSLVSSEVQSSDDLAQLALSSPKGTLAEIVRDELTAISTQEQKTEEKEVPFADQPVVASTADSTIMPNQSVNITEIITQDTETILQKSTPIEAQAEETVLLQEATEIRETKSEQNIGLLKIEQPQDYQASLETSPLTPITVTENVSVEKEAEHMKDKSPLLSKADANLENANKVASISEILTNQLEQDMMPDQPKQDIANVDFTKHHVIEEADVNALESLGKYNKDSKPTSSHVHVDLTEARNVASVEEVLQTQSESEFRSSPAKTELASEAIFEHKAIEELQIRSLEALGEKPKAERPESFIAEHLLPDLASAANVTEVLSTQAESELIVPKPNQETAQPHLEGLGVVQEQEVKILESLGDDVKDKHPSSGTADLNMEKGNQAVNVTEILTYSNETEFKVQLPSDDIASVTFIEQQNIEAINVKAYESLDKPVSEALSRTDKAAITLEKAGKSASITEILPSQMESDLAQEVPKEEKATSNILESKPIEGLDVKSYDNLGDDMTTKLPDFSQASVDLENTRNIASVSEILSNQQESDFESIKAPTSTASPLIDSFKGLKGEDVNVYENTSELFKKKHIPEQTAVLHKDEFESVMESTITIQGSTQHLEIEQPNRKVADLDILTEQSITVTQTMAHGNVGEEISTVMATETTAEKRVEDKPVGTSEDVLTLDSVSIIKPDHAKKLKIQSQYVDVNQSVIVTEQTVSGSVITLDLETPNQKNVTVALTDTETPRLQISEVQLLEHPGKLNPDQNVKLLWTSKTKIN